MRQLPLPLSGRPEPTFENFVPGPNAIVLQQLRALAAAPAPVFLWGEGGSGKTHLLRALAAGAPGVWLSPEGLWPEGFDPAWRWLVLDDVHRLDASRQRLAFALLVEAQAHAAAWAASAPVPPVDLALRDDLRTRLGWGLVCALQPLGEEATRQLLVSEAARRGITLRDDVVDHLLHRFARDLGFLMGLLDRLDHYALSQARPVTLPLLRRMVAEATSTAELGTETAALTS